MNRFDDLFIFEMANNHQGSVEHGLKIIREMAKITRDYNLNAALKFQFRKLDTFIHPDYVNRTDVAHIPRFKSTELSLEDFGVLLQAVKESGMMTMVTPFDEASVEDCLERGVDILKIASCSASDWPLLTEIAKSRRPIICSTGGLQLSEIDSVVSFLRHKNADFAVMHCVGVYPTPNEIMHLNFIDKLRKRYPGIPIGWSGHEAPDNLTAITVAVAKGAKLFERHVGVPTDKITLNKYSMNPAETALWAKTALEAKVACGPNDGKRVTQSEYDSLLSLKRGVFAKRDIVKGEELKPEDVFFAMPCGEGQLTSGEFGRYRAKFIASTDYAKNGPIREMAKLDETHRVYTFLHDIRGLLYEAQIEPGPNYKVELSHHDGIDQFRRTGAALIDIVNRNYCKKLIVVLPGQSHPGHMHKQKEETFQLLWGDLTVDMKGQTLTMKPGMIQLVEPNTMHAFSSKGGAVFEEISTTHIKGDSFYEDDRITKMDLAKRKTVLEQPF